MIDDRVRLLLEGSKKLDLDIKEPVANKLIAHLDLVQQWNEKMNLTAITGCQEAIEKHIIDSIAVLRIIDLNNMSVTDLGSGPGFPGIPIAVCCQGASVLLVETSQKKATFLKEVIERLGLKNVMVSNSRAEELGQNSNFRGKCDVVVSRAVAEVRVLAEYALPLVRLGGEFIAFKGPNVESEMKEADDAIALLGGEVKEVFQFTLPFSTDTRSLVVFEKVHETPGKYPRRPGIPNKRPL